MIVKLQQRVLDPTTSPYDEYLYECQDVHVRTFWLKEPDDRFHVHGVPDAVWSPFTAQRGYQLTIGDPEPQTFNPYGVLLLTLEGPKRHTEIWIENGIAWIMNDQGKTISKAVPPRHEGYLED